VRDEESLSSGESLDKESLSSQVEAVRNDLYCQGSSKVFHYTLGGPQQQMKEFVGGMRQDEES